VSSDPHAFLALDLGAATTSVSLIGRTHGYWRLIGSLSLPSQVPVDAIVDLLLERARAADSGLASELGIDATGANRGLPRLIARSAPSTELAIVAATERGLGALQAVAERTGWRFRTASLETAELIAMTEVLLDRDVSTVLVGADEPPGADERYRVAELAALVAGAAVRRPDLTVVLAGSMAEHQALFERNGTAARGELILAPAAAAGEPPGAPLRALLERLRAPDGDSRTAFVQATQAMAEALDRRVEAIDIGLDGSVRASASPGLGGEPGSVVWGMSAAAGLAPVEPDESIVDGVLGWSTVPIDRHRMRDRLRELRLAPWSDVSGDGGPFRMAAARAALRRLVDVTPAIDELPAADLLVVSGGAWAVAPGPAIALAISDVIRRPGVCQVAFDHARLMAPLGTIEEPSERRQMIRDLADDLLVPLGSVVMPEGMRAGRSGGRLVVHGVNGSTELDLVPGGLELVDLPPGESAVAEFQFRHTVRLGARGRHFAIDVAGGLGGLLVDLRDVPLRLPDRADRRQELLAAWQEALWAGSES
jgi:hypothetical protein